MEIPYTVTARKDTGLFNSKVGIWLFLASEVMLFGGLFSGYVFLRVYADYPWPERALPVVPGLINTFILIASSVTVVFAWAALKMRKWLQFQIFMLFTLACAATFMVLKGIEYKAKWEHQAVRMTDFAIVEGHTHKATIDKDGHIHHYHGDGYAESGSGHSAWHLIAAKEEDKGGEGQAKKKSEVIDKFYFNKVVFKTNEIVVNLESFHAPFIETLIEQASKQGRQILLANDVTGQVSYKEDEKVTARKGTELSVDLLKHLRRIMVSSATNNQRIKTKQLKDAWVKIREIDGNEDKQGYELVGDLDLNPEFEKFLVTVNSSATFQVEPACTFYFPPGDVRESDEIATLKDNTVLRGQLDDHGSAIEMAVDAIDFRFVAQRAEEKGISPEVAIENTWIIQNNEQIRDLWEIHTEEVAQLEKKLLEKYGTDSSGEAKRVPTDTERYRIGWQALVNYGEGKEVMGVFSGFAGPDHKKDYAQHFPELTVPRETVNLESKFTPKWNTYYAIYFLITGLHGLHVIGGAIVLGYFLFFGKKMYRSNPEHLANRVEVGGLFWHFVDLVWIFLFPILYLM